MSLLENIIITKKNLSEKEEELKTLNLRLEKIGKVIPKMRTSYIAKMKQLKRACLRHNLRYSDFTLIIEEEIEQRRAIDDKILDEIIDGSDTNECRPVYGNLVVPIFSGNSSIFNHALTKIIKQIAVKRLIDLGKIVI